jgi:hypothetical protein
MLVPSELVLDPFVGLRPASCKCFSMLYHVVHWKYVRETIYNNFVVCSKKIKMLCVRT